MLLVVPRYKLWASFPPLGALYVASQLRKSGGNASLIDANFLSDSEFWRKFDKEISHHDSIGISSNISHAASAVQIASKIREKHPDRKIIWGGPYPSAEYRRLIPDIADAVVVGEGEIQVSLLAEGRKYCDIPGIAYYEDGSIKSNDRPPFIQDINQVPFPAWDLVKDITYNAPGRRPAFSMITQRGCPFRCINCSTFMHGNTYRTRSPENIVEEMEMLVKDYGCREIHIWDDNFTLNPSRVKGICEAILRKGLDRKLRFVLPNGIRADIYDDEMFSLMKRAGFYLMAVAVESGDQEVVDKLGKGLDLSKVPEFLRKLDQKGFRIALFFMMGFPFETPSSLMKTIDFAASLPGHHAHFFIVTPLPGTELFNKFMEKQDIVRKYENETVNYEGVFERFSLSGIESADLARFHRIAYRRFYLNPKRLYGIAKAMTRDRGIFYDLSFLVKNLTNLVFRGHRS